VIENIVEAIRNVEYVTQDDSFKLLIRDSEVRDSKLSLSDTTL
jgi:hypothetical protein